MKIVPPNFGYVEEEIFRCGLPEPRHYGFLSSLRLKTCVLLSDTHDEAFVRWLQEYGVTTVCPLSPMPSSSDTIRPATADASVGENSGGRNTIASTNPVTIVTGGKSSALPGCYRMDRDDSGATTMGSVLSFTTPSTEVDLSAVDAANGAVGLDPSNRSTVDAADLTVESGKHVVVTTALPRGKAGMDQLGDRSADPSVSSRWCHYDSSGDPLSLNPNPGCSAAALLLRDNTGVQPSGFTLLAPLTGLDSSMASTTINRYGGTICRSENGQYLSTTPHARMTLSEPIVVDILHILIDPLHYPLLITCPKGKYWTGIVCGCLRKMQRWNFVSILEEYRRFAGVNSRTENEEFIELFDNDLVNLELPSGRKPTILYHL